MKYATGAEFKVLEVLFDKGQPMTVPEIAKELRKTNITWVEQTIRNFLKRLEAKQIVASKKEKKLRYYSVIVAKEDIENNQTKKFLDFHFQGSLTNFLTAFSQKNELSEDEIRKVKEWVNHLNE